MSAKLLTYVELREIIKKAYSKYPGVIFKDKYNVINDGFPGTFNLSLNEPEHLDAFGSFIDYNKNLFFAKIQPVIRSNDFEPKIIKNPTNKHLSLFEIAGG